MDVLELVKKHNGFEKFNPMQEEAISAGLLEKSLVVSAPTASGKTLVAEIAALNTVLNRHKKVVYTCPLRALASEHGRDFKEKYSKEFKIRSALSTGDFDSGGALLSNKDVIFTTNEKLNSLLNHNAEWLKKIGLLIVDEIHTLGSDRGPTLEMVITKLKFLNKDLQVLGLSATVPNSDEIAKWLNAKLAISDYRPVKLSEGVFHEGNLEFKDKQEQIKLEEDEVTSIALDTLNKGKQALIFANTRKNSEGFAKRLAKITEKKLTEKDKIVLEKASKAILNVLETPTEQCRAISELVKRGTCFHNAGLLSRQRHIIEVLFKKSHLKFISSTPTLAAGVNLPAFRVIIPSPYRYSGFGMEKIPVYEFKQMSGRCVTGDAIVYTNNGIKTASEIFSKVFEPDEIGQKDVFPNLFLLGVELETGLVKEHKVTSLWKRKASELLEIETRSGKHITVTPDHPLLAFTKIRAGKPRISGFSNDQCLYETAIQLRSEYGMGPQRTAMLLGAPSKTRQIQHWFYDNSKPFSNPYQWKEAKQLVAGENYKGTDYLSSPVNFKVQGELKSPISYLSQEKFIIDGNKVMNKQGHQVQSFPLEWSENFCRFIAKIMSDGSIYYSMNDNSYLIRYYNKSYEVQLEYASIVNNLFGKRVRIKWRRGTYFAAFKSLAAGNFLENIGVPSGKKSFILRLPDPIFYVPDEMAKAFISEYSNCDGWETPVTYCLITSSELLARDFCLLMSKLGWISRLHKKKPNTFRQSHIWEISVTKSQFEGRANKNKVGNICPDQIKSIRQLNSEQYVYDFTVDGTHNFIANGLVVHNSGRPKYDTEGQAILIAKTEMEKDDYFETFINGEIERIDSALGNEKQLRFHLLSAIATHFVHDLDSAEKFFSSTFYASQNNGVSGLFGKINSIVKKLEELEFVIGDENYIEATPLGRRVAELYLDPMSAHQMISMLRKNVHSDLSYLYLISSLDEFAPWVSVPRGKEGELYEQLQLDKAKLPVNVDVEMFTDNDLLPKYYTSQMLGEWITEVREQEIADKFKIQPGILRAKLDNADWLSYSALELAKVLELEQHYMHLNKIRKRLATGIREELIPLAELRGIGRVRARRLYNAGVKGIGDIKNTDVKDLEKILGQAVAVSVKGQLEMKK